MLWHILKYYLCFVLATYFKRRQIKNVHHVQVKGPVIIAMNHPNAFMDPVAFTVLAYPPRMFYLARGDAFKKGIVTMLLESLGIIPIFRIQDGGKEGLKKNDETYERVNALLKRNKKIIVFAEGLCIQERRLRPLKKGIPRMVFGAVEMSDLKDLTVVPVGANYSHPSQFRSNLFFNIGEPIKVSDYLQDYNEAPAKTMNRFLADLAPRMKELIIHINHKYNEQVIEHIEEIYRYDFFKQQELNLKNLEHDFMFSTKVVETINKAEETHPEKVKELYLKTKHYFTELKKHQIKDWLVNPAKQSNLNYLMLSFRVFIILLSIPIYIRGLIGNYIPYKLTHLLVSKKVRIVEFKASFYMGIGAFLFLAYYLLQYFMVKAFSPHDWLPLLFVVGSIATGFICLHLAPFRKKTIGIYRVLKLRSAHTKAFESLNSQRKDIIKTFEALM
jgi:1-acyl-sn-glycerol-3-phosphate acyltransferase